MAAVEQRPDRTDSGLPLCVRPLRVGDLNAVRRLHERVCAGPGYLRVFGAAAASFEVFLSILRPADRDHVVLVAEHCDTIVGVAVRTTGPGRIRTRVLVDDRYCGCGIAALLDRRIVDLASRR